MCAGSPGGGPPARDVPPPRGTSVARSDPAGTAFDLGRFGIQFVASPLHGDGIVVTGPVTTNMELALRTTYAAVPAPKIVIAVGACAISGGPFAGAEASHDGTPADIPVDLYIPGCPPHPLTILDACCASSAGLTSTPRATAQGSNTLYQLI